MDTTTRNLITDSVFCNDRTVVDSNTGTYGDVENWTSTGVNYYFGTRARIYDGSSVIPNLICKNKADKFTVNSEIGNGALTYPVGLITADELLMAGGNPKSDNTNYYLYTNQDYWSMSPYGFYEDYGYTFYTTSSGKISDSTPDRTALGVRPVISISKDANLSGDGTWNNPYVVGS